MWRRFSILDWFNSLLKPLDSLGDVKICPESVNKNHSSEQIKSNDQK